MNARARHTLPSRMCINRSPTCALRELSCVGEEHALEWCVLLFQEERSDGRDAMPWALWEEEAATPHLWPLPMVFHGALHLPPPYPTGSPRGKCASPSLG